MTPGEQAGLMAVKAERAERGSSQGWRMPPRLTAQEGARRFPAVPLSPKEQAELWAEMGSAPHSLASEAVALLKEARDYAGLADSYEHEMVRCIVAGNTASECMNEMGFTSVSAAVLYGWAWEAYEDRERMYRKMDKALCPAWQLLASCVSRLRTLEAACRA